MKIKNEQVILYAIIYVMGFLIGFAVTIFIIAIFYFLCYVLIKLFFRYFHPTNKNIHTITKEEKIKHHSLF